MRNFFEAPVHVHDDYALQTGDGSTDAGQTLSGRVAYGTSEPSAEGAVVGSLYAIISATIPE